MSLRAFSKDFVWGAATSAYQIEGAWDADGKGESIWDRFVRQPYRVRTGETGDRACDHYHRMPEDVTLMRELGLQGYRFSIAWTRVLPEGRGQVNSQGLDFYDRLVDELLAVGIQPNATLNHWDFPQALQDAGGWPSRESVGWFVDYARVVFDRLGDRVPMWSTHNEPWVSAFLGYQWGLHAPGLCDSTQAYQAVHHLLLSHGKTVQLFRQGGYAGKIGLVLNLEHFVPASDSPADRAASRRAYLENSALFLDPVFHGRYPEELMEWIGPHAPLVSAGDMEAIAQPVDYLGINHYRTEAISYRLDGGLLKLVSGPHSAPGWGVTQVNWGIDPPGFSAVLENVRANYGNPTVYITENGIALPDQPDEQGFVDDTGRVNYLRAHLLAAHDALQAGSDLRGYYVWSLLDNFEWAEGYPPRFGIVRVEFSTGRRIPKRSAQWYREVIAANGVPAFDVELDGGGRSTGGLNN